MARFPAIPADSVVSLLGGAFRVLRIHKTLLGIDMVFVGKVEFFHLTSEHGVFFDILLFTPGSLV
jgi:hypothetical protein